MIDINRIRNNKEEVESALRKKDETINLDKVVELDIEKRKLGTQLDEYKKRRNEASELVPKMKKEGKDVSAVVKEMQELGELIAKEEQKYNEISSDLFDILSSLPNIPDDDLLAGGKENNKVVSTFKEKPVFDFEFKNHVDISKDLNLIDYERGVKLSGQGSWVYTGNGALLEWALLSFFIEEHIKDGYTFMLVPHMLNYECGYTAGQFPKFENDVYWIDGSFDKNGKFLLPTAETALVNLHRGEILAENELPKKYFSYTPCYRREAGSSRIEERGIVRGHQFNKIEMFQYTTPENSDMAFDELVKKAESLMQKLGLHYQVSKLAAGDCSASMTRTYDIEVWIPSMNCYKEVSSASNCRDYQARRGNIKYKNKEGKNEFVNTLNASGLATSRLVPAILEQFQQSDGSVIIPEVLRKYMNNMDVLR